MQEPKTFKQGDHVVFICVKERRVGYIDEILEDGNSVIVYSYDSRYNLSPQNLIPTSEEEYFEFCEKKRNDKN